MDKLKLDEVQRQWAEPDRPDMEPRLAEAIRQNRSTIIVLDDDPTGVQTVHDVTVVTDWDRESIRRGFLAPESMFFILTNSRSFTATETRAAHEAIAKNILAVSQELNKDFLIVSRGDSTLRGHYPLETQVLAETLEAAGGCTFDGEILCPFFAEGGRYTVGNIHYVNDNGVLIPCGETEFALDKTFGYASSHLGEWIEEKTGGRYAREQVTTITLEELRASDVAGIMQKLREVSGFGKVTVNALDDGDLEVFAVALYEVLAEGKTFMFRTAASWVRVMGGIRKQALLTAAQLIRTGSGHGGLIVAGSHTRKTTRQLEQLEQLGSVATVVFDQHLVVASREKLQEEVERVLSQCNRLLADNRIVLLSTRRERLDVNSEHKEDELRIAVAISETLTDIVARLQVRPLFVLAKGGITSSDIGTKALQVKQAVVAGQIRPGIPVWLCGSESRFPQLPFIIFPGNVGTESLLKEIVEELSLCEK